LRFLKITLFESDGQRQSFPLEDGLNIVVPQKYDASVFAQLPLVSIFGTSKDGKSLEGLCRNKFFRSEVLCRIFHREVPFIFDNGTLYREKNFDLPFTFDDFLVASFFPSWNHFMEKDVPLRDKLKRYLVACEFEREKNSSLYRIESDLKMREQKIRNLEKELQILELKKRKSSKIERDIAFIESEVSLLKEKHNLAYLYKESLVKVKNLEEEIKSLKTESLEIKKEILQAKENHSKLKKLDEDIKSRFPHLKYNPDSEYFDYEMLQEKFKAYRNANEKVSNYESNLKSSLSGIAKAIGSLITFSVISLLFIFVKALTLFNFPGILFFSLSIISFISAIFIGFYYYLLTKKGVPDSLLQSKALAQKELLATLKAESLFESDADVGDIYEFVFRYLQDMIAFLEKNNEYNLLRKNLMEQANYEDFENKLNLISSEIDSKEKEIASILSSCDSTIHTLPEREDVGSLIPVIDQIISNLDEEIDSKVQMIDKMKGDFHLSITNTDTESFEKTKLKIDDEIASIWKEITSLRHIKEVYDEAEALWFSEKLDLLIQKSSQIFCNIYEEEDRAGFERELKKLLECLPGEFEGRDDWIIFELTVKLALCEILDRDYIPLVLEEPFGFFSDNYIENLKKILLLLFKKREVILITSQKMDFTGNIIYF